MNLTRRHFLSAIGAAAVASPQSARGQSQYFSSSGGDDTAALQSAINQAAASGVELFIEGGRYQVSGLTLPSGASLRAVPGAAVFTSSGQTIFSATDASNIMLNGLTLDGSTSGEADTALLQFETCENILIENCGFADARGNGITTFASSGRVQDCNFSGFGETAVHLQDSTGMFVTGNEIRDCGNGGVRVWRYENGLDGSIVNGNRISGIGSTSGNGQNGNGVNVFQADGVICSGNVIADCDFSALRANTTNDTIFTGNQCFDCREVAIFSEFGFSGTIIANNLIDRAATGISITNLDSEGHLAVCSGNIVRNITRNSPTNPDTVPIGIFAEADTAITGNVVENVPGAGVGAGWGPYLRNVLVSDNVVRDALIGVAVSVAEGAGLARVHGNLISGASAAAIAGMKWQDIASADLVRDADLYPNVEIGENSIS